MIQLNNRNTTEEDLPDEAAIVAQRRWFEAEFSGFEASRERPALIYIIAKSRDNATIQ